MTCFQINSEGSLGGKAARTYWRLVDGARAELKESGTVTVNGIAARTEVAPATFYTYFSSKSDVIAAAFNQLLCAGHRVLVEELDVAAVLEDGLEAVVERMVRRSAQLYGAEGNLMRVALSAVPEEVDLQRIKLHYEEIGLIHIQRFLELCAAAGRVRDDSPRELSVTLLLLALSLNTQFLLQRPEREAVTGHIVESICALLKPQQ